MLSGPLDLLSILLLNPKAYNIINLDINITLVDSHFVYIAENRRDFLERYALYVREEEEYDGRADSTGNDEAEVEFPADSPRIGVSVSSLAEFRM